MDMNPNFLLVNVDDTEKNGRIECRVSMIEEGDEFKESDENHCNPQIFADIRKHEFC